MANAVPEVMDAAGAVTKSNDEDGVSDAIYKFILEQKGLLIVNLHKASDFFPPGVL